MTRSRLIRTYNYLAVCLNTQKEYPLSVPKDRLAPLYAAIGAAEGYLMCHNELNTADEILKLAQPFVNSDIDK
jgi:hypothetical protein